MQELKSGKVACDEITVLVGLEDTGGQLSEYVSVSFNAKITAEELGREIFADLEKIPAKEWKTDSRQNVRPTKSKTSFQKTVGLMVSALWRGIPMPSNDTYRYRKLTMKTLEQAKWLGFNLEATTLQFTTHLQSRPYRDIKNRDLTGIIGLLN